MKCPKCKSRNTVFFSEIRAGKLDYSLGEMRKCSDCDELFSNYTKDVENRENGIEYFLIRRFHCGSGNSDIYGITTNEEVAKAFQSVFCGYEKVIQIK